MALNLISAPAGAGKTQYVVEQIRERCRAPLLPRILVLVPSAAQLVALRERLAAASHPTFGVTLTDFHTLYHNILDTAGALPRLLPEAARYRLVRYVIRAQVGKGNLSYLARIADKPGLISAISDLIAELKEARVEPEVFADLALTPRTRDLASIYTAYQELLRLKSLADREGMGWLALAALAGDSSLYSDYYYIAADGFDEFNPTQLGLLTLLAARVPVLDVTLTYQAGRRAHARFAETLTKFGTGASASIAHFAPPRAAALEHLEQNLFEQNSPRARADGAIALVAAPDRTREIRQVAREIKSLLLQGVPPSRIGLVVRRLEPYQAIVREVFSEFGIPHRVREGIPLSSNPLIAALMNLATLSTEGFPWRATLDVLRSPYFQQRELTAEEVAQIERLAREAVVVKGQDAWLKAFEKPLELFNEEERRGRLVDELGEEEIAVLRDHLRKFFLQVSPPPRGSATALANWVESLIGPDSHDEADQPEDSHPQLEPETNSLGVIDRARRGEPELVARDLAALAEFKKVLQGLVEAAEVLGESEGTWGEFISDLADALPAATYDLNPSAEGRILVTSVTQSRGVPRDYVFIAGLVESEFPLRAPEDPLLTVDERERLRASGIPLADRKARDEATLFYEGATLVRKRLHLSYPYLDDDANPLFPSPYLESVLRLFDDLTERRLGVNAIPVVDEAASMIELGVAVTSESGTRSQEIAAALKQDSPAWRHSLFAREVEALRESNAPCDEYGGVISDSLLRQDFAKRFAAGYPWSATQFNEWGACGFRFFAKRLLKLEESADPEEGMEVWQRGALYHRILEETFREFMGQALKVTPETLEAAKAILQVTAGRVFAEAPRRFAFRQTAWWEQEQGEMVRRLLHLLDHEAERAAQPFELERDFDLHIDLPHGRIRIHGTIDRIDRDPRGNVLIDYKSGTSSIGAIEVEEGRNLQLPVYVLAAEALGYPVAEAFFWHIPNSKESGNLSRVEREEWLATAEGHMERFVESARAGAFAVRPTRLKAGACSSYCEFAALCRAGRWSMGKEGTDA